MEAALAASVDHSIDDRWTRARSLRIKSALDDDCVDRLSQLARNSRASFRGSGQDKRGLCIIGPGGAGKTSMINFHLDRHEQFRPADGADGKVHDAVLRIVTQPNSTTKALQLHILRKLKVSVQNTKKSEPELTELILKQMEIRGLKYLLLDELQRCVRGTKTGMLKKVQDLLIGLVSSDIWPVHAIYVGTDDLLPALEDQQIDRRLDIWAIPPMKSNHAKFVADLTRTVVVEGCSMRIGWEDENDVARRLMHANRYCMGNIIEFLQLTCFNAMEAGRDVITITDLEERYRKKTSCLKMDNIMIAPNFKEIDPTKALLHMTKSKGKKS